MRLRISLFSLLSLVLVVLAFFVFESEFSLNIYRLAAYPIHLICFGVFAWSVVHVIRGSGFNPSRLLKDYIPETIVVCVVFFAFIAHGHWGIITVSDEPLLVSTSQNLHMNRTPLFIWKAHDFEGTFTVLQSYMDKRPIAFSVLLSLVHDISGYRLENAYVLNMALGLSGILMMGCIGRLLAGRIGFILGVILLGSLPVYHYYSRGGGFDIFNIIMIEATILCAIAWYKKGDFHSYVAFIFAGAILCVSRYEAPIYAGSIGVIVLYKWIRDKKIELPWILFLVPFFLALIPLQQQVFKLNENFWELESVQGADSIFGLKYFMPNFGIALTYFFDGSELFPNSPYISAVGLACAILFVAKAIPMLAKPSSWTHEGFILSAFGVSLFGHFLLMMFYFYGQFDGVQLHRFSLPSYVLLIFSILGMVSIIEQKYFKWAVLSVMIVGAFFYSIPTMAKSFYYNKNFHSIKQKWVESFIEDHEGERYMVVDRTPLSWTMRGVSAVNYRQSGSVSQKVKYQLDQGNFETVYVIGGYMFHPNTGEEIFMGRATPSPDYIIGDAEVHRLHPFFEVRVAKVISIEQSESETEEDAEAPTQGLEQPDIEDRLSDDGEDAAKREFYRNLP